MINFHTYTLPNGLRIVHKPTVSSVSYCGFIVNTGTRDEADNEHGMAHFIEHMLFKGTAKRRSHHIINRMENVGGDLNAYTNKEETVIYSVFLEEHFERAFELLSDITFNSQFPEQEIEKEIEVIIDEIHSYEDNPSELIFDEFENMVFANSQIGHNILGTEESLDTFDSEMAKNFYRRNYVPSNMVFFSLGSTDFKKIVRYAEKYLSEINLFKSENKRVIPIVVNPTTLINTRDTSQAHALIGSRAYSLHDPKRKVLNLLNNILGGPGMNSRLNISLREKHGYVYNVESSQTSYTDTGLFSIYFGSDKKNADKCVALVHKELKKLRENKLTSLQLATAKKQLIGQIGVSSDNRENVALSLGKSFMHYNHYNTLPELFTKIESITSEQLQDVANEIFDEQGLYTLMYK